MFGSNVLEIAIGLVFVYLILSLLCSAINEMIASVFALRSKLLEKWIRRFLADDSLSKSILGHRLIKGLASSDKRGPSYIPARSFSLALFDTVMEAGKGKVKQAVVPESGEIKEGNPDNTKDAQRFAGEMFDKLEAGIEQYPQDSFNGVLRSMLNTARAETDSLDKGLEKARLAVEKWYDDSMERLSGWYKRWTRLIILILALILTVGINADTIMITDTLSRDSALRAAVVAVAIETSEKTLPTGIDSTLAMITESLEALKAQPDTSPTDSTLAPKLGEDIVGGKSGSSKINLLDTRLDELILPIGWGADRKPIDWFLKILGLLCTVLAVSLGAPFWFDMLNKLVNLRASGKKVEPEKEK